MTKITIPIETKVRELDGKLWLAINLAQEGHQVAIGPKKQIRRVLLTELRPDIHIDKELYEKNKNIFKEYSNAGITLAVLDSEGAIFPSKEYYFNWNVSEDVLKIIDLVFCWGNEPADAIINGANIDLEKLHITGNPRFDLHKPALRDIFQTEAKSIKEKFGKYILVNTNFGRANNINKDVKEKRVNNRGSSEKSRNEYQEELFEKFVNGIDYLAKEANEHNIVIRPHPTEDQNYYIERFKSNASVYTKHTGNVCSWIYGTECVIHNGCTTGVESALMETPVVAYEPKIKQGKSFQSPLPNRVSTSVTTPQELKECVNSIISSKNHHLISNKQRDELHSYFYNLNSFAAENITDSIAEYENEKETEFPPLSYRQKVRIKMKNSPAGPYLQEYFGWQTPSRTMQKFPSLSVGEIKERIHDFEQVVGETNLTVEPLNQVNEIYWIKQL